MQTEDSKELSDEQEREVRDAYDDGCFAVVLLALRLAESMNSFRGLHTFNPPALALMPMLQFTIHPALEILGDFFNNSDAVDAELERRTAAAFVTVRKVIEKFGRGQATERRTP